MAGNNVMIRLVAFYYMRAANHFTNYISVVIFISNRQIRRGMERPTVPIASWFRVSVLPAHTA